ncbi:AI-2E family transporter [Algoriphagus terrigena]|uniref:AI-2E family transporter n=1 Tax=Algoriphagus terrigena TaxID=344884 RepID=UPI00041640EA|nr:AI-2E family transporter [Algoriphagus terrigena]
MNFKSILIPFALLVLALFFLIKGLVLAEVFLVPLTFGVMIALICTPLARKFQRWGFSRLLAAFTCVVMCVLAYLAFFSVIAVQAGNISEQWPKMEKQIKPRLNEAVRSIEEKTGLEVESQLPPWLDISDSTAQSNPSEEPEAQTRPEDEAQAESSRSAPQNNEGGSPVSAGIKKQLGQLAVNVFGFLGSSLLVFIYTFFLLYFRHKVKLSILRFFHSDERKQVKEILEKSSQLALNFLGGRLLLVLVLAVLYTIGLFIAGVENAIVISVIAAMLNLIPYVGSIAGYILSMALGLFGGAEIGSLIVISVTFAVAQFLDNNVLEPFVVGDKVNLNPLATIILVVLGGSIWGVAGMILSIPLAGIFKIIFDATHELEPLGYMLGVEDSSDDKPGFFGKLGEKLRGKVKKKRS